MDKIKALQKHRFVLTPKPWKQLSKCVYDVEWNSIHKTMVVRMHETSELDVYKWMQYVKQQHAENLKGPFVDLDKDALMLSLIDEAGKEFASFRFKNINITDHTCEFCYYEMTHPHDASDCFCEEPGQCELVHRITISYQEAELTKKKEEVIDPNNNNQFTDAEWKS